MTNSNDLYGGFTLKKGDHDKDKIWSGKKHTAAGNYVSELQTDLKNLGVFVSTVDGDFGKNTKDAVKRLQWNANNITKRIKNKAIISVTKSFSDNIDGIVGNITKKEIHLWKINHHESTGDLVRVKETIFSNITLSDHFKKINHPSIHDGELVVSHEFVKYLIKVNEKAKDLAIELMLNQTMRVSGEPVSAAVVTPASKSQHLIGHAMDCNIIDGESWNNSTDFANDNETENAKKFIKAMKENGLRWGGDFSKVDTPHFDKQVLASGSEYDNKYFFNQRMISEKQEISLEAW